MKCFICGAQINPGEMVTAAPGENWQHRFSTSCKKVNQVMRQQLQEYQQVIDGFINGQQN